MHSRYLTNTWYMFKTGRKETGVQEERKEKGEGGETETHQDNLLSLLAEITGTARHALHESVSSLEETEEDRREEKIGSDQKVHEPKPHKSALTFHHLISDSF